MPDRRASGATRTILLRLLLGLAVLGVIAWRVDLDQVRQRLAEVAAWPLIAATLVFGIGLLLHAMRWRALLRFRGVELDLATLAGITAGANFLSLLLPGNLGGDLYRIHGVRSETSGLLRSTGLVLLDRYCGLAVTLLMALAAMAAGDLGRREPRLALALLLLIALLASPCLLLVPRVAGPIERTLRRWSWPRVADAVAASVAATRELLASPRLAVEVLVLSALMKVCVAADLVLLAASLDLHLRWLDVFVFLPLHNVVSALPFTPNGLGFREAGLVVFLTNVGLAREESASLALLHLIFVYATAFPGVVLLRRRGRQSAEPPAPSPVEPLEPPLTPPPLHNPPR